MSSAPRFTVVVPVYQGAAVVGRAIESVRAQELAEWELVVVDDGSTDGSGEAARAAAAEDARVRVVTQPNRGRSAARNAGAAVANGEYVIFLDADDEARPDWLRKLWDAGAAIDAQLIHCGALRLAEDEPFEKRIRTNRFGALFAHQLGPFRTGMFAVRLARFRETGGFAEDLSFGENYELGLRLAHAAADGSWASAAVDEPLVVIHYARVDPAAYDRARYESARVLLERHRDKLVQRRGALSAQYAVLGVNAARIGRRREAASALLHAIAADPGRGRNYLRLVRVFGPARGGRDDSVDQL